MVHILNLIKAAVCRAEGLPDGSYIEEHDPMSHKAFTFFHEKFMPRAKLKPKNGHLEWLDNRTTPYLLALQVTKANLTRWRST